MEKVFEIILKVSGFVAPIVAAVIKWWGKHKEEIEALVLRIEKDSADGWTKDEKEKLVLDLFYKKVYPKLPWFIRLLPKRIINSKLKKIIAKFCEKSHEMKNKITKK